MKKQCELCGQNPATVPDRNKPGRPINRICHTCHGLRIKADLKQAIFKAIGLARAMKDLKHMTFNELMDALRQAESHSGYVQLVSSNLSAPFPKKGYPRGALLCNNGSGQSVWAYHATSLRLAIERDSSAWIASQKPATITPADNSNPDSEPTGAVDTTFPYGHNQ